MEDLIKALMIFKKYKNKKHPTCCEHNILVISGIEKEDVSDEDLKKLEKLDFFWSNRNEYFYSLRFGSC